MNTCIEENGLHIVLDSKFLPPNEADDYFSQLKDLEYYPLTLTFGTKKVTPLRRVCAFSDDGALEYSFSGITVKSKPWTPALKELKTRLETAYQRKYNFCLLNFYPNGEAYISPHKDDEKCHLADSVITTVSFGASRTMNFTRSGFETVSFNLEHGSVLNMHPPTNQYWFHGIKKSTHADVRISLTFREMAASHDSASENDDDPLIDMEYANLIQNPFFNAQSEQLDYERNRIQQLEKQRKDAKRRRKPEETFDDEDPELNKKMRAIYEIDLDYTIMKVNLSETFHLSCTQYKEDVKVHLREHYQDSAGVYKPTKNGFTFPLDTWYDIYSKFNDFSLKYPQTSFVANNSIAFISFYKSLVIKSLHRTEQILTLNAQQYENLNNCIVDFTKTITEYILGEHLRKTLEKYIPIRDCPSHTDTQLIQILISCIETNLNINCLKRFICDGCLSNSLSQYKHMCETLSKREIFETFSDAIFLTLDNKEVLKQFKSQVLSISQTFLCLINCEYLKSKIFDIV